MTRLRAEWLHRAERDLLDWVPDLGRITSIATTVEEVAANLLDPSFDDPRVRRAQNSPNVLLIDVAGSLVVSGFVDVDDGVLYVTALNPGPDPDADPDEDPEPDSYEDDE